MLKEINGHFINVADIKYIGNGSGQYFKFMVGTKEIEWSTEYWQDLIDACKEYEQSVKGVYSVGVSVGQAMLKYSAPSEEEALRMSSVDRLTHES